MKRRHEVDIPVPSSRDDQGDRIDRILSSHEGLYIRQEKPTRRFAETVPWMAGARFVWRLLPDDFGPWNSVYKRFAHWLEQGVWQALLKGASQDADLEWRMLDSTVVGAHACAAGAKKMEGIKLLAALPHFFPWAAFQARSMLPVTPSAIRSASRLTAGQAGVQQGDIALVRSAGTA